MVVPIGLYKAIQAEHPDAFMEAGVDEGILTVWADNVDVFEMDITEKKWLDMCATVTLFAHYQHTRFELTTRESGVISVIAGDMRLAIHVRAILMLI
jgi:hypothetical protein